MARRVGFIWLLVPRRIRVHPSASHWRIHFVLLSRIRHPRLVLRSVKVDGASATDAVVSDRRLAVSRTKPRAVARAQASALRRDISKGAEVALSVDRLPFQMVDFQDYRVMVEIGLGALVTAFPVTVAVRSLPVDRYWVPADLHLHTDFSDGSKPPAEVKACLKDWGYRVAYVTDHSDLLLVKPGAWGQYADTIAGLSDAQIAVFPGTEVTVGRQTEAKSSPEGDMLAYGISSLSGLDGGWEPAQRAIDLVHENNPHGPSSPGIAHPTRYPQWTNWEVRGSRGIELMSGVQHNFTDTAFPMVRWRSQLTRLLDDTFARGYLVSARTGSDWHGRGAHPGYVTWIRTGWWVSKSAVDTGLYHGRTVASQMGGLAYMTFSAYGVTCQVGDILRRLPTGAKVKTTITLKSVETGPYTVEIWEDDKARCVFSWAGTCSAGMSYSLPGSFTFPGGKHFYYLYVYGADHIYSSPIFVDS